MRLRHLALPAAAGLTLLAIPFAPAALAAPQPCGPSDNPCVQVFDQVDSVQTFQVPAGVTNLLVAIGGGAGGNGLNAAGDAGKGAPQGGRGGAYEAIVSVTPGETLNLVVGGRGGDANDTNGAPAAAGGYGGGGAGTAAADGPVGGGGGGSFLFDGAGKLLVAAGGGGGGGFTGSADAATDGGAGGASAAGTAGVGVNGGGAATTAGGGAPGAGSEIIGAGTGGTGPASGPSTFGTGGAAAGTCSAGGGGGGYYGGGSGGCDTNAPVTKTAAAKRLTAKVDVSIYTSGGGGGGAGFVDASASQVAELGDGANLSDQGVIALGYTTIPTTTTLKSSAKTLAPGQEATLNATVTGAPVTIGDASDATSAAGKVAAAAFGAQAQAKALAVPTQPAPTGATVTPGTACGTTPCTVTFFVNGVALGDPISVDPASGKATVVFTAGSEQGVRNVTARYDGNLYYLQSTSNTVAITVAGLANTGPSNVEPMIAAAAGLLVTGAGLMAFGRRRRPQFGTHRAA